MSWISASFVLLTAISAAGAADGPTLPAKIQPHDALERFAEDDGRRFDFIVRGSAAALQAATAAAGGSGQPRRLPFIDGLGISLDLREARRLAAREDITQLWYVPAELFPTYCHVIEGIAYAVKTLPAPGVINMSLGPPAEVMPLAGNDDEPMHAATRQAADSGFVVVMAIGNYNYGDGENDGVVNPWCRPEWVICVGAASADAKQVWSGSARGAATDPKTWPDVVANGIDVISAWPTGKVKSEERRKRDEENPMFQKTVAKDKWHNHTIESGTSMATAQVSRAAGFVIGFVRSAAIAKGSVKAGDVLFAMTVPGDRFAATSRRGPRLTGDVRKLANSPDVEITYRLEQPWKLVKQLLLDSAVPMTAYPPSAVGAGFVDPGYVELQFPAKEKVEIQIAPIKVIE